MQIQQQQSQNQSESEFIKVLKKQYEHIKRSESRDKNEDNDSIFKKQNGQTIISIPIQNENKYDCTAIAFHPKQEQYLAVAVGNKVFIYELMKNQVSLQDESRPGIIKLQGINEQEIITAINFPVCQQNEYDHDIIIGTSSGTLKIARYNPKEYLEGTQDLKILNLNRENYSSHKDQITCILSYTFKSGQNKKQNKEEVIILTSSYDSQILQLTYGVNKNEEEIYGFKLQNIPMNRQKDQQNNLENQEQGHLSQCQEAVYWISLSDITEEGSQNLIASGYDNYFYVWKRQQYELIWKFICKYKRNGIGSRVAFFGSKFVVWQMFQKDYINILEDLTNQAKKSILAQNLKAQNIIKVQFNQEFSPNEVTYENDKFPLLLNNQNNPTIMGIKYGKKIFFLRSQYLTGSKEAFQLKQNEQSIVKFFFLKEYLECSQNCTEGAISPSGQYIVVYDYVEKKIQYQNVPKIN